MRQLGVDFADYWLEFKSIYYTAVQAAFGGPAAWAGLKGDLIYFTEIITAAPITGYELEVSPGEAVALMVILQAYAFNENHGTISRILRPSLRERMRDHDSMLAAVSPLVIRGVPNERTATVKEILTVFAERNVADAQAPSGQQPLLNAFAARMSHHLAQDLDRSP